MKRRFAWLIAATITLTLCSLLFQPSHAESANSAGATNALSSASSVADRWNGELTSASYRTHELNSFIGVKDSSHEGDALAKINAISVFASSNRATSPGACAIACPPNVLQSSDPGLCGAVVNYPPAIEVGTGCGTITCSPASGSTFPVGITTVFCSATGGGGDTCTFTVNVYDTVAPTISCPSPSPVSNAADQCGAVVNYAAPTSSDNCGFATTCSPASGSFFPAGTTTVTCRVSDSDDCSSVWAVDTSDNLILFEVSSPGDINSVAIGGLGATEDVVGIDFRPATGGLYGLVHDTLAVTIRLVTINPVTGATSTVGSSTAALGTVFGFDFNPVVDLIRVVSDAEVNLRINPNTGAVITDNTLNPPNPAIVGAAYTNNSPGASSTTLYAIDAGDDSLKTINMPNSGTITNVGALGVDTSGFVGFDIAQCGTAYAVMQPGASIVSNFYTIDLVTGAATPVGSVGGPNAVRAMSVGLARAASCSFTVTVNDTQPPNTTVPANITQSNDPNQCAGVVTYSATTSDNCPGVSLTCGPASGSSFPVGTTTVTCTGTDASGNTSTSSFSVKINDTQNPTITCPANQSGTAAANAPGAVVTFPPPTASDNCPGVTVACSPASGSTFPPGSTPVTCTATDAANNMSACSFSVFVSCTPDPALDNLNPLVISRFRESGPNGANDEFVEIHNPGAAPYTVSAANCTSGISVFASAGNGTTSNAVSQVCRIPNGTVIPGGGYYLCTGSSYSLNARGQNGGAAGATSVGDAAIGCGGSCLGNIPDDAGLALLDVGANIVTACTKGSVGCPTGFNYSSSSLSGNARVLDSVGFGPYGPGAPGPQRPSLADNFCEGPCLQPVGDMSTAATCINPTGLFPVTPAPPACYGQGGQYELLRRQTGFTDPLGTPHRDTNNNPADFILVSPNPAVNMGLQLTGVSGVMAIHGAAAPKNLQAPADRLLNQAPFDGPGTNQLGPRNAERNYNQDPEIVNPINDPLGTFVLRLRFVPTVRIVRTRFSIDNLSTPCGPQGAFITGTGDARNLAAAPDCGTGLFTAILKAVNSHAENLVDATGTTQFVFGTVLEDLSASATPTPPGSGPLHPFGGGVDSTYILDNVTTPSTVGDGVTGGTGVYQFSIPAGTILRVKFKFGVVRSGRFILLVQPMASPSP